MMIVSLDWEKPRRSSRGEEASFVHCAGCGGAELAGTTGCLLLARPGIWETKMQDPS